MKFTKLTKFSVAVLSVFTLTGAVVPSVASAKRRPRIVRRYHKPHFVRHSAEASLIAYALRNPEQVKRLGLNKRNARKISQIAQRNGVPVWRIRRMIRKYSRFSGRKTIRQINAVFRMNPRQIARQMRKLFF